MKTMLKLKKFGLGWLLIGLCGGLDTAWADANKCVSRNLTFLEALEENCGVLNPAATPAAESAPAAGTKQEKKKSRTVVVWPEKKATKTLPKIHQAPPRAVASLPTPATAPEAPHPARKRNSSDWFTLRVSLLGAFQPKGYSTTVHFAWAPRVALSDDWGVRAQFGWAMFHHRSTAIGLHSIDYQLMLSWIDRDLGVGLEVGGGLQTLVENATNPVATAQAVVPFGETPALVPDHLVLGYSGLFYPGFYTHQAKVGVGFSW